MIFLSLGKRNKKQEVFSNSVPIASDEKDHSSRTAALIADRDAELANLLASILSARGFACLVAGDDKDAFTKFSEVRPNIVVIGYTINDRADGMQTAKEILSQRQETKVIVLTDSESTIGEREERSGVELFIRREDSIRKIIDSIFAISDLKKPTCDLIAR